MGKPALDVHPRAMATVAARPARRSPLPLLALIVFLLSIAVDLRVLPTDGALGQDFDDFYVAATAQQQGLNPYDGRVLARIEQRTFGQASFSSTVASPPAFFVAFRPFTGLAPRQGYLVWLALSTLALLVAARSLARKLGIGAERLPAALWLALVLGPATVIAMFLGQISLLLVACYIWAIQCLLQRRFALAGLLLALTLVKPHLMIVPVALLCGLSWRQGGRRVAVATLLAVALLCLLAVPFGEPDAFRHWLQSLLDYGGKFDRWQPDISSLAGIYLPFVSRTVGRALSTAAVLVGLACTGWMIAQGWRRGDTMGDRHWWQGLAFGIAVWLTVLPYVHPYDDTLALISLAVLVAAGKGKEPQGLALIAIAGMLSLPEMDLMGFRPNLTFSYTVLPLIAMVFALASWATNAEPTIAEARVTAD